MKQISMLWVVLFALFLAAPLCGAAGFPGGGPLLAQAGRGGGEAEAPPIDPDVAEEATGLAKESEDLVQETEKQLSEFTSRVQNAINWFAVSPYLGWVAMVLSCMFSLVLLFAGWTLLRHYFMGFVTLVGVASGAYIGSALLMSLAPGAMSSARFSASVVGAVLSGGVCLFCSMRAKPLASFLVVIFPFLIISTFVFPISPVWGAVLVIVGFVLSGVATARVRPLVILSTSMLGAGGLIGSWGLLGALGGGSFAGNSFAWLTERAIMMVLIFLSLTFIGLNFQSMTGPPKLKEDGEKED